MNFKVLQLDHVAIRVKDMEKSARWYADVLGFKRVQAEEWGAFQAWITLWIISEQKT